MCCKSDVGDMYLQAFDALRDGPFAEVDCRSRSHEHL